MSQLVLSSNLTMCPHNVIMRLLQDCFLFLPFLLFQLVAFSSFSSSFFIFYSSASLIFSFLFSPSLLSIFFPFFTHFFQSSLFASLISLFIHSLIHSKHTLYNYSIFLSLIIYIYVHHGNYK
uniref:Uncharacterized protein n=1 Tax=Cacopsylla melanoneura TaxID=428564 RepID=A0A8D8VRQ9_9HEMI